MIPHAPGLQYPPMAMVFERDELLVELSSTALSRDESIRVAESLAVPPSPDTAEE